MRRLLFSVFPARYSAVMVTLVLIATIAMVNDMVAVPNLVRDVVAAIGGHLAALAGSAWHSRYTNPTSAKMRTTRRGSLRGIRPP